MLRPRVIPIVQVNGAAMVKTVCFQQPRYLGDPINAVKIFNELQADELVLVDISATKERRTIPLDLVEDVGLQADMPLAVGGGITTVDQIRSLLRAGAEKAVIGTSALENPDFVARASDAFGASTITVSIDVKGKWFGGKVAWSRGGTKASKFDPVSFAVLMERKGAGEILLQSIERDGTMKGYDIELIRSVADAVRIPVVAVGGAGDHSQLLEGHRLGQANGVGAGSLFVYHGPKKGVLISYPDRAQISRWFPNHEPVGAE